MIERLVGHWRSRGSTVDGEEIAGTDVYEWFGPFLVHHVDVLMGSEPVRVLEMIGPVDGRNAWPMRAFDHGGGFGEMTLRVDGDGLLLDGASARSFVSFPSGRRMAARWERLVDDRWERWMDMEFTRDDAD